MRLKRLVRSKDEIKAVRKAKAGQFFKRYLEVLETIRKRDEAAGVKSE